MRALLLALMLLPGEPLDAAFTLEVDAERWGEFERMHTSAEAPVLVLEGGRLRGGFLALWWPDVKDVAGRHERNPAGCEGRPVTVVETLGQGLRARQRSWTLIDGCPVAWEIESVGDDGTMRVVSLSFAGREFAVSR